MNISPSLLLEAILRAKRAYWAASRAGDVEAMEHARERIRLYRGTLRDQASKQA